MKEATFPRWAGPIVGTVVGALFAARATRRMDGGIDETLPVIVGGAVIGCLAGCLIWLLDTPPAPMTSSAKYLGDRPTPPSSRCDTLVGRFLAAISLPLSIVPLVGLLVSVSALVVNRRTRHWPNHVSIIAVILSVLITGLVLALTIFTSVLEPNR